MKKLFLFVTIISLSLIGSAEVKVPTAQLGITKWWQERKGIEVVSWTDHNGKTNSCSRMKGSQDVLKSSNGRGCSIKISPELQVLEYKVSSGYRTNTSDLSQIAPATYDLINGKFYTEMTEEEKKALWDAYDAKVAEQKAAEEAERNAPAKFDVSKTPAEYRASLLGDRDPATLTREERRELIREVGLYTKEYNRINRLDEPPHLGLGNTKRVVKPRETRVKKIRE